MSSTLPAHFPWKALLMGLFLFVAAAPPVAAQLPLGCVNDAQGRDDLPGQKDLNQTCNLGACSVGGRSVTWNFDDTSWTGGNTGDSCVLFDADGNGNADRAVCVTVSGAG